MSSSAERRRRVHASFSDKDSRRFAIIGDLAPVSLYLNALRVYLRFLAILDFFLATRSNPVLAPFAATGTLS